MTKTANNKIIQKDKIEITKTDELKVLLKQKDKMLKAVLKDDRFGFMATLVNIYETDLQGVTPASVLNCALSIATLKLPLDKNLGYAYIIKYKDTAQVQLGYKGLIQLALRSGNVKKINSIPIKKGQLKRFNPLTETMEFDFSNYDEYGDVIGYASYLELHNGFTKTLYCTKTEILTHAQTYSQSYKSDIKYKTKKSVWNINFESMAVKTMIKKIMKYTPLSTEMKLINNIENKVIKEVGLEEGKPEIKFIEHDAA